MIEELGLKVKTASKEAAKLSTAEKNTFLQKLADSLVEIRTELSAKMQRI